MDGCVWCRVAVDEEYSGIVMEKLQQRKATLQEFTEVGGKTRISTIDGSYCLEERAPAAIAEPASGPKAKPPEPEGWKVHKTLAA